MQMRTAAAAGVAVIVASTFVAAQQGTSPAQHPGDASGKVVAKARATIAGEGISGTAEFAETATDTGSEVMLTVTVKGVKPGLHGVHLHAIGKCEAPSFTASGGHFDPGPSGNTDPDANHPYHMGDIPNLRVGPDGTGTLRARTTRVTLSEGPLSVFDADGTAIIIHGNPDQGITGPSKSGVSGGPRIACGVLEKAS